MAERLRERIEALFSGDDLAGVSRINSLLGVNLWDAPSFRADIRIDFHEDGRILRATLLTEPDLRRMADLIEAEADEEEVLRPGTRDWCSGMRRAAKVLRMNANETARPVPPGPAATRDGEGQCTRCICGHMDYTHDGPCKLCGCQTMTTDASAASPDLGTGDGEAG